MQARRLAGQTFSQCESCAGIWIPRGTILRLRGHGLESHPLLRHDQPSKRDRSERLACPRCGKVMHVYDYRGSKVTVDQCQPCDHVFLDAGELAAILRDWEKGLVLDENSRGALLELHVGKAAATEGTEHVSLIVFSVIAVLVAVRIALVSTDGVIGFAVAVALALLSAIIAWRVVQARRRAAHALHLAKIAELDPRAPASVHPRLPGRKKPVPFVPPSTPPVIRGASAGYREPAPEMRNAAQNPPSGQRKWPDPGD